jgi:hypothetical protein
LKGWHRESEPTCGNDWASSSKRQSGHSTSPKFPSATPWTWYNPDPLKICPPRAAHGSWHGTRHLDILFVRGVPWLCQLSSPAKKVKNGLDPFSLFSIIPSVA